MPDTLPPYNWPQPIGNDYLKIGFQAIRDMAAAINTTVQAIDKKFTRCTSGTRPAAPADGDQIYETDTKAYGYWEAGTSHWIMYDTVWQTFTPKLSTGAYNNYWTQGNGTAVGRYYRKGREITYAGIVALGSSSAYNGANYGALFMDFPVGYFPGAWTPVGMPFTNTVGNCVLYSGAYQYGWVSAYGVTVGSTPNQRRIAFYNSAAQAATGTVNSPTNWFMSASGHTLTWNIIYDTAFEA